LRQPAYRGSHQMAVHGLLAGVTDCLLGEAAGDDLRAPARCPPLVAADWPAPWPSAPPSLSRYTHNGCDCFTGNCSVPDRVTWLAAGTDRTV